MPGYSELIKNFEKIRDFARDLFIYGFRGRGDYHRASARSYDNERRRIESYLAGYVVKNYEEGGRTVSISSNTTAMTHNPLFKVWQAKSFTKNDCFLHFALPDVLGARGALTASELTDAVARRYVARFERMEPPDAMTVRNKLNEYAGLGILAARKRGRRLYYSRREPFHLSEGLETALTFYQNVLPAGFLGASMVRGRESGFIYKQIFFAQTLDDEILLTLLQAVRGKKSVTLLCQSPGNRACRKTEGIPVRILSNTRTGRRYAAFYEPQRQRYSAVRLDYIKQAVPGGPAGTFDEVRAGYEALSRHTFSLMHRTPGRPLAHLRMVLRIDERTERYMLGRIAREGRHGTLAKTGENEFTYEIDVADTTEMRPWLRTFIGRILSLEGTERAVIDRFKKDVSEMAACYGEAEADVP